ncbi:MAG: hypothetical protein Q8R55_01300 [Candidatus Taylorbacteria bacterium]|nr:hypothetical protein [Candidatus Taylorbacteria bacterium]
MWYIEMYILASIVIGVVKTAFLAIMGYDGLVEVVNDEEETAGNALLKKKGIQKEVFGERVVHYPVDSREKEMIIKVASAFDEFCKKHKVVWGAIFILTGVVMHSVVWPKDLYQWVENRLVRYNEDEADPRLLRAIRSATTANELMQVAAKMHFKDKALLLEENDAFLRKAILFKDKLEEDDWGLIQEVADKESELNRVALEHLNIQQDGPA